MEVNKLPDVVLGKITQCLELRDRLSFSSALGSPRISSIILRHRIIRWRKNYNLKEREFRLLALGCNRPEHILELDIGWCYWIPAHLLTRTVSSMTCLQILNVEETQLSLAHVLEILESCRKVTHLAFDFRRHVGQVKWNSTHPGLQRLISLKMTWFDYVDGWSLVFQVLSQCLNCLYLHLSARYRRCDIGDDELGTLSAQFPRLDWMSRLKSFVCFRGGPVEVSDPVMESWGFWMTSLPFSRLERLWFGPTAVSVAVPNTIRSWNVGSLPDATQYDLLEEIGGVDLDSLPVLPKLRLAQGTITDDQGLYHFIERQPSLEHLFVEKDVDLYADFSMEDFPLPCQLRMQKLRTLVYTCSRLDLGLLGKLLRMSGDLERVIIDCTDPFHWSPLPVEQLAHLSNLRQLSMECDGFGSANTFHQILTQCKRLESLHVHRRISHDSLALLNGLVTSLHLASNLHDLSLIWAGDSNLKLLTRLAGACIPCDHLERLHLQVRGWLAGTEGGENLPDTVDRLIRHLPGLVFMSLVFDVTSPEAICQPIERAIRVARDGGHLRPAFRHHCGPISVIADLDGHWDDLTGRHFNCPVTYLADSS